MRKRIENFVVMVVLAVVLAVPLAAQSKEQGKYQVATKSRTVTRVIMGRTVTQERPVMWPVTEENFVRYRSDLLTILNAQKNTAGLMNLSGDVMNRLESTIQGVTAMQFADVKPEQQGFIDLTALKSATVQHQAAMASALANGGARVAQFAPGDPFPNADYASFCPLNPQPPEVAFVSGLVLLAAELARDIAQDVCNQVVLALGVGGNVRLACIVTDIIYSVAKVIDYPIQACHSDTVGAQATGTFERLGYLREQVNYSINNDNSNKAKLSTQLTNAENHVVTNDNNNKASLSGQVNVFQSLSLRLAIEANLAEDPNTSVGAGLFELPASQGGYLELARQVLIDVYNAHVAAAGVGVTVYNPSTELSLGATYTTQKKYREAYYYYRRGYRSVVKYP